MRRDKNSIVRPFVIVLIACGILIVLDYYQSLDRIRGPLEQLLLMVRVRQEPATHESNELLQAKIASLESTIYQLTTQNQLYEKQINAPVSTAYSLIPAPVLSVTQDADTAEMRIGKGQNQGINEKMEVVFEDMLIGVVRTVTPETATVKLIANTDSKIAVISSNRARGLITGTLGGLSLTDVLFTRVLQSETIKENDTLVTSGEDGLIKNLLVGTIVRDISEDQAPFQQAEVLLAVNPKLLDEVFVVRK